MRETKNLEFKENVTNTFLKTVSAYANYEPGEIWFGVADDGKILGMENTTQACIDIENRINDSIFPAPDFSLEIDEKLSVIKLKVVKGIHTPYLYKSKAYKRNDSATVETDGLELRRLILDGQNTSFEELPSKLQNPEFTYLTEKLKQSLKLQEVTDDTLKTLELYKPDMVLVNAGELVADKNTFCGTDIIRFGDTISIILDRETYENESILKQYDESMRMYRKYYQYEVINGALRERVSLIPEEAFREALANALVHRTWDVKANINIAMFADRIEITSPGGLPEGMEKEDYYAGGISILRNRIIGMVFLRLQMIERFGTGIRRIMEAYKSCDRKPVFDIHENSIRVVLPVMSTQNSLTEDENTVLDFIKGKNVSSSAVVEATGFGKTKAVTILNKLVDEGYIHTVGNGRGLKYSA